MSSATDGPEFLRWLELLLIPAVWMLVDIKASLAALRASHEATKEAHEQRLSRLETVKGTAPCP